MLVTPQPELPRQRTDKELLMSGALGFFFFFWPTGPLASFLPLVLLSSLGEWQVQESELFQ